MGNVKNEIYQYSVVNALMAGVAKHGISASKLLSEGNLGLGTFQYINGELILLDDKVYQLLGDGSIRVAGPDEVIPYACATHFEAQHSTRVKLPSKDAIDKVLHDFNNHAGNLFMSYRIEGRFRYLKCRTVRGQEYDGQPLHELGEKQSVDEYRDIEGTMAGFYTPASWQGFFVAGQHLHFIDTARKVGGHVLEMSTDEDVFFSAATISQVHIDLPTSEQFNAAQLVTDDMGLRKIEG